VNLNKASETVIGKGKAGSGPSSGNRQIVYHSNNLSSRRNRP
jgi:hypothetical protein